MTKEIASVSKLRQVFPKGVKAPSDKSTSLSLGKKGLFGYSLTQNDPETLRFAQKHKVNDHGDIEDTGAFNVATKHSLDDKKNKRLKGHGKGKEDDVYENTENITESGCCPKCDKAPCKCGSDKSQGEPAYKKDKKLLLGGKKLKEETIANCIAMEILEARKAERLDEKVVNPKKEGKSPKVDKVDKINMCDPNYPKLAKEEVKLSVIKDTKDKEFTKGMEVNKKAEGEIQTHRKPAGPGNEHSKKLDKREIKSPFKEEVQSVLATKQIAEEDKVEKTMHEFKHGTLHSGSKTGPKVTDRKQAIAIALNQKRKMKEAVALHHLLHREAFGDEGVTGMTGESGCKKKRKVKEGYDGGEANAAEPGLEGGKKSKWLKLKKLKEGGAPTDTPIKPGGGVPTKYQNLGADTGFQLEGGKRSIGTEKRMERKKGSGNRSPGTEDRMSRKMSKIDHFGQIDEKL